ncbi:rhodanese-like domain-containing protein [Candidatus Kaiserbacteria bacterium]|nr:rhodanese-like domain-containing protein [Candidatus Kaiserbacteria bacterium]
MPGNIKFYTKTSALSALLGVLGAALVIYLTPLKNLNLVAPSIKDANPQAFYEEYRAKPEDFLFLDVRNPNEYYTEHAEGSLNVPINVLYTEQKTLPKSGKTIVLICTGGALSGVAYHYLEHQGFLNLRRIDGGVSAWKAAGLPTVRNSWYSSYNKKGS